MPESEARPRDVGSSLPVAALVAAAVSILVLIGGFGLWRSLRVSDERGLLVLATGPESGAYHSLGSALGPLLEAGGLGSRVEVRSSEGSGENMQLLEAGEADIEVVKGAPDLATAGPEDLLGRRERLVRVRERAFTDLVAERLEADESFVILQNHIDSELASIQRRLGRCARGDPG